MAAPVKHPAELIARVKAAVGMGIPVKVVAKHSQIPFGTVKYIVADQCRSDIEPDPVFAAMFEKLIRGPL